MSLKGFSTICSCDQFVQPSWNNFSNFGQGEYEEHICEIVLKSSHWPRRRCRLKVFLFLALVAILFSRDEPFKQFW